jgi:tripartite-type tricarboxylate transporter receptor subunit TctC
MGSFVLRAALSLAIGFSSAGFARAAPEAAFPTTTVKFVVPFPAGGTTDLLARVFAQRMAEAWGQAVVVENRAGAGGVIGSEVVARLPPDGHSIVIGTIGTHGVSTSLVKNLPFHPERDFAPVTLLATLPNVLAVNPNIPAGNLRELIAYAKQNPGKLSYASAGAGTASHIAGEYFKRIAGIDVVHVPYKGSAPALADLIAGHVSYTFDYMPSALPAVTSGKLRALATTGPSRSRAAPDIPTVIEQGLPDFNVVTWYAIYAPAGTPKQVLRTIRDTFAKAALEPDVIRRMDAAGVDLVVGTPEELAAFQHAEIERWSKFIRESNISAD